MRHTRYAVVAFFALAACSGSTSTATTTAVGSLPTTTATTAGGASASTAAAGATPTAGLALRGLCPDPVVLQTDWNPEAEHGGFYQLLGKDFKIDTAAKTVRGPLMSGGQPTGVDVEIRAGGPAIGFQPVPETMYRKPDIFLGYVSTDDAVEYAQIAPTLSVMAPFEKGPQMVMWDPATYPNVKTVADLKAAKAPIRFFGSEPYMAYLVDKEIVSPDQLDASYDGSPKVFTAEKGRIAQQGFASSEPFFYANELPAWAKPVKYQLIHDTGWQPYPQSLAARPEVVKALPNCLRLLVPMLQRAQVEFVKNPAAANALILQLVKAYDNGWQYSPGIAEYSVKTQLELGLVSNGTDKTLGDFDLARVKSFIASASPVLAKSKPLPAGLTAEQLVTNEFIDKSIGL